MLRQSLLLLLSALTFVLPATAQSAAPPVYLQQAFNGVNTLQTWYTPANGLYQTTGWWNSANALTVLANYSRLDRTTAYYPVFANTLHQAPKVNPSFTDGYYDDDGWWALALIDIYDLTGQTEYLTAANTVFTTMTGAWDSTCGGGIWWSTDRQYKNAIANELFLSVASELAARLSDPTQKAAALDWAQREWTWFKGSGMINAQNLINDGLDTASCKNNGQNTWSYNQGVILGGLTQLGQLTQDTTLVPQAQSIANATLAHLTDANGVLHDVCDPDCGQDGVQFKGVFLRNLVPLQAAVHDPRYKAFADTNAESIWNTSQGANYQFGQDWSGPFDTGNAGSQASALDAILAAAAMEPGAAGSGASSSFTLTASPASLNLTPGGSAQASVTLTSAPGFTNSVAMSATVIGGSGVTASLTNSTLTGTATTMLSVSTTAATSGGNYLIAVTGLSGSVFQAAYVSLALPDFSLASTNNTVYVNQQSKASDAVTVSPINGFTNRVHLTHSPLPLGVTGGFSPQTTNATSTLTLGAELLAPTTPGRSFTATGTSGATTHTTQPLNVAVSAAISNCGLGTVVDLGSAYNLAALSTDGLSFTGGGLDGGGFSFSANLIGPARVLNGIVYNFGLADKPDAVYAAGQTIVLPPGHFNTLQWLGTAVGGRQANQTFTVTYTDGTTAQVQQSLSDWFSPNLNANEAEAVAMPYRNGASGTPQNVQFNLYGYSIALDETKVVRSLTLPNNRSVVLFAATLSYQDFGHHVDLTAAYNNTGIYTDGTAFTNGGVDGVGYAYSADALTDISGAGSTVVFGNSSFHMAPANQPNALYAAGQTIALAPGYYQYLKLLGTAVGGDQVAQKVVVRYVDGTSQTLTQSFSDWYAIGSYANESLAIRAAYRTSSNGTHDGTPFNVYEYRLNLNPTKAVASVSLPNNRKVVLLGITEVSRSILELEPFVCKYFGGFPAVDAN